MTLTRVALQLVQDFDPTWWAWMQTWERKPEPGAFVDATALDDTLRCCWTVGSVPVEVIWKDRDLLDKLKSGTAEIAGPLLWRMARVTSEPGELDALMRQLVCKETGLVLEPTPFVRKGTVIASRMDTSIASGAKKSSFVTVMVDQHGTLVKMLLTEPHVRALLDRFLRRYLYG